MTADYTWPKFERSLPRKLRPRARAELLEAVLEGQADDVLYAVAACRTLEAMGFHEAHAIRLATAVVGPHPVPTEWLEER